MRSRHSRRARSFAAMLVTGVLVGACTSTGESGGQNPIRGIAETTGFATTPPPPADFVRTTRPSNADFLPVGVTPPPRAVARRTPEQIKALEKELDSTLNSHSAIAGKPRPKETYRSAADNPDPQPGDPTGGGKFLAPEKPAATQPAAAPARTQRRQAP